MSLCAGMRAQIVSSSSRIVTTTRTTTPSNKIHYVRLGLNFMHYVGDGVEESGDGKLGYDLTFGFQKPVGPHGLYWGMEYGLGSRGDKYSEDGYKDSYMCHNIHFSPFQIGFKYNISGKWSVDPHLGVFVSADYTGKHKWEFDFYKEHKEESESMGDWEDYNRVDVGMRVGAGVWYGRFNLDLTWQRGFLDSFDDVQSSNLMLRFGLAF